MNENEKIEIVFYKDNKGIKYPLQTKSEAIEKMAKAMIEFDKNRNKDYPIDPYKVAEATLNALLEDK